MTVTVQTPGDPRPWSSNTNYSGRLASSRACSQSLLFTLRLRSAGFSQVSGTGHAFVAIGAGLIVEFITLVVVGIIISTIEWIQNHPVLFILASGLAMYAWVHFHGSP